MKHTYIVAALYSFTPIANLAAVQQDLQRACADHGVCGTLLVAPEGINGTIAGSRKGIDAIVARLRALPNMTEMEYKESYAEAQPFYRMKVRLKKEIVTLGVEGVDPNTHRGVYVTPQEWNKLISDPDTIVIDTRNDYEVGIGTFKGALNPHTETFRAFPAFVEENLAEKKKKKVAMFCTGGIRCEKASAYMKAQGFEDVYHLKGGILKYLEAIPESESLWQGECFVFDQRVAVGHGLALGSYDLCPSCRHPVSATAKESEKYIEGIACPACFDTLPEGRKARAAERQKQIELAEKRGEAHIGAIFPPEGDAA